VVDDSYAFWGDAHPDLSNIEPICSRVEWHSSAEEVGPSTSMSECEQHWRADGLPTRLCSAAGVVIGHFSGKERQGPARRHNKHRVGAAAHLRPATNGRTYV